METEKKDRRHDRSKRTRDKLVSACRQMMVSGIYRPTMVEVARNAEVSIRSGFQHFPSLPDLHREALRSETTRIAVARNAVGRFADAGDDAQVLQERLVEAVVFGGTVTE